MKGGTSRDTFHTRTYTQVPACMFLHAHAPTRKRNQYDNGIPTTSDCKTHIRMLTHIHTHKRSADNTKERPPDDDQQIYTAIHKLIHQSAANITEIAVPR